MELQIQWSDGQVMKYSVSELRNRCPCAAVEKSVKKSARPQLPVGAALPKTHAKRIQGMRPIGNYAYATSAIGTGIFTLELLHSLPTEPQPAE